MDNTHWAGCHTVHPECEPHADTERQISVVITLHGSTATPEELMEAIHLGLLKLHKHGWWEFSEVQHNDGDA